MTSGMLSASASSGAAYRSAHTPVSPSIARLPMDHPFATVRLLGNRRLPEPAHERSCSESSQQRRADLPSWAPPRSPTGCAGRSCACWRILAGERASLKTRVSQHHVQLFDFADLSRHCESRHGRRAKDRQYSILGGCIRPYDGASVGGAVGSVLEMSSVEANGRASTGVLGRSTGRSPGTAGRSRWERQGRVPVFRIESETDSGRVGSRRDGDCFAAPALPAYP
jgi:hypothetical protein